MRIGVSLPQREPGLGRDISAITEYARAAEAMGYDHIRTGEHVLGANAASRPGWQGPYTHNDLWHEPFVLFGYLAGLTKTLEFVTSIVILPQRQTALVAKQAAALDLVSGGRLRLGIGVGWNPVEFEALGEDFSTRGRRIEEQIEVMRALWTQELVTYRGRWDTITDAGLNPMPVQRPIPIWIGGGPGSAGGTSTVGADRVLRRIAKMADGWFPSLGLETGVGEAIATLRDYIRQEGRDISEVGIEGSVSIAGLSVDECVQQVSAWRELGATHLSVNTAGAGFTSLDQHIDVLHRLKDAVDGAV
ncbi:MAG TPA: LLM class F420-dependent oxidoreductase [Dehalococcoidia bacterium]|nr:LLM class F420-dependent oxidoreductase [Dehalococcoidia bacterium]